MVELDISYLMNRTLKDATATNLVAVVGWATGKDKKLFRTDTIAVALQGAVQQ